MIPFRGSGLYIGESPEKVVSDTTHVVMCDFKDFDKFTNFDNLYDYIYLDDMIQKLDSLEDVFTKSFKSLRAGGYCFAKVPDFKLYEKYIWPSIYMIDHKLSFSNEVTRSETKQQSIQHFVEFATKRLKLKETPKISLIGGREFAEFLINLRF